MLLRHYAGSNIELEKDMIDRQINIAMENALCVVTPMPAEEYCNLDEKSLPIFGNYRYYFLLEHQLDYLAPSFDHPRLYAALKTLFGDSTSLYDHYKCSFGYQFLLKIIWKDRESEYSINFTDIKGGITFIFRKILATSEELEKYKDRTILHEPLEDDFSKEEMEYFMSMFTFYLIGFMESFEEHYNKEFARSLDYCHMIYGFRGNKFFLEQYENQEEFWAAKRALVKSSNIPFNRVRRVRYD